MKEITVEELKFLIDSNEDFQLIDVRDQEEYNIANIKGELIPLNTILKNSDQVDENKKVVVHCRSGQRSALAIMQLESQYGFDNLYNLKGGIIEYARKIDPSLNVY